MDTFWQTLKRPIFALAPLSGVTDSSFRQVCKGCGADLVYSELASVAALVHSPRSTLEMIRFDPVERPYIVQLFGSNPEYFARAAELVTEKINPDGIDINFGCPAPKVTRQGAGAALMTNLPLAREVVESVITHTDLPVSIKVRIAVKEMELNPFLEYMSGLDIKAIMIHGRTYAQRFSGPVSFERTRNARHSFGGVLLANGGAMNAEKGIELLRETGADGIGVARGALGNPWIFRELKARLNGGPSWTLSTEEMFETAMKHAQLAEGLKGWRGILEMRKHLCWYIQGIPDAGKIRQKLAVVKSLKEVEDILGSIAARPPQLSRYNISLNQSAGSSPVQ
ncbi:MAG: tRNA-dihydrouridine synthase [Syntrophobacter sp.]